MKRFLAALTGLAAVMAAFAATFAAGFATTFPAASAAILVSVPGFEAMTAPCRAYASAAASPLAAYADIPKGSPYEQPAANLTALGILSGKPGGVFDPGGMLTRAEFAKMAVISAGLKEESAKDLFPDTPLSHWANGYISAAARNGLLIGYPDGTFRPDERVTLSQAVTIVLRLLGYDAASGLRWPDGYLLKAGELSLTAGIENSPDSLITRGNAAVILDRALVTDMRKISASGKDRPLIERMGYTLSKRTVIVSTKKEDGSLMENEVGTDLGKYASVADMALMVSRKGRLVLNSDNEVVHFIPDQQRAENRLLSRTFKDCVSFTNGDDVPVKDECVVYYKGKKTSYAQVRDSLDYGAKVTVYRTADGGVDYMYIRR